MGKIKLRELIDNLYAGEEIPQKLKHNEKIWLWDEMECFYKLENGTAGLFGTIFDFYNDIDALDTELEIIEEDKKIEKLEIKDIYMCDDYGHIYINFKNTWNKINEIIDRLNEMDKGE